MHTIISTAALCIEGDLNWDFGFKLYTIPIISKELSYDSEVENKIYELSRTAVNAFFTSEMAVRAVFERLETSPDWRIYCLSGKTKQTLLQFIDASLIERTAPNSTALSKLIQADSKPLLDRPAVFFCGDKRMPTLPATCRELHIPLEEVICYKTICIPNNIGGDLAGILFFSPSAVSCYFNHNPPLKDFTVLFAIGETTATAIRAFSPNKVIVAPEPSKEALLEEVKKYFEDLQKKEA
ncbi:uroporphyrinogen-III synthase [Arachidicoccus rhizosphaerae]|jgi:uroporphyrinogen-III synthase|uniref:Uroporphyrinogen-III synthase n=1 Tax=Arachidicoccus rhizosphaerae TaxID=551991 RepID=A0A1H3VM31_9BACT|nr:uroporphyrinogen-III synthase [Arachidicoccus rhizosphaerae]SDZ75152.1 uroporphyrinogen-III synthase [Arachidicoccus rhizosphaerae]